MGGFVAVVGWDCRRGAFCLEETCVLGVVFLFFAVVAFREEAMSGVKGKRRGERMWPEGFWRSETHV